MALSQAYLDLVSDAKTRVTSIDVAGYRQLAESGAGFYLVDVREESEWGAGRAEGAIHLSKGVIERDIESRIPDRAATIVLYCGGGYRSALAADNLLRMGYENPISLDGGWKAWIEAGLPVVR